MEVQTLVALIGAAATVIAAVVKAGSNQGALGSVAASRFTAEICIGLGVVSVVLPWRELHVYDLTITQTGYQMVIESCSTHGGGEVSSEKLGKALKSPWPLFFGFSLMFCLLFSLQDNNNHPLTLVGVFSVFSLFALICQVSVDDNAIRKVHDLRLSYGYGLGLAFFSVGGVLAATRWNAIARAALQKGA